MSTFFSPVVFSSSLHVEVCQLDFSIMSIYLSTCSGCVQMSPSSLVSPCPSCSPDTPRHVVWSDGGLYTRKWFHWLFLSQYIVSRANRRTGKYYVFCWNWVPVGNADGSHGDWSACSDWHYHVVFFSFLWCWSEEFWLLSNIIGGFDLAEEGVCKYLVCIYIYMVQGRSPPIE